MAGALLRSLLRRPRHRRLGYCNAPVCGARRREQRPARRHTEDALRLLQRRMSRLLLGLLLCPGLVRKLLLPFHLLGMDEPGRILRVPGAQNQLCLHRLHVLLLLLARQRECAGLDLAAVLLRHGVVVRFHLEPAVQGVRLHQLPLRQPQPEENGAGDAGKKSDRDRASCCNADDHHNALILRRLFVAREDEELLLGERVRGGRRADDAPAINATDPVTAATAARVACTPAARAPADRTWRSGWGWLSGRRRRGGWRWRRR
mmetsp:Transcript_12575/g.32220  ORF Transcript_12575/g.32220 Transcript_12575/m.32220 type:complete len:261 (+) Transcript_12575:126-908(+)